jgi:O-antigen/teichoic acid export membrane protein
MSAITQAEISRSPMSSAKSSTTMTEGILGGSSADVDLSIATPQAKLATAGAKPGSGGLIKKGIWAVMDQGLFAGSNCVVNVMLANWLSKTEYGAFSTAFAAFLLLGVVHTAMLIEPMLVFAPARYKSRLGEYLGALTGGHLLISFFVSALLLGYGLLKSYQGQPDLAYALYWFAATAPATLYLWLMRRACYAKMNPRRAAFAGIGYLVMMMIGLAVIHEMNVLSIATALLLMGGCSLITGFCLAIGHVSKKGLAVPMLRDVSAEHWRYGRWATATALLSYIPGNIYYFLLPSYYSLAESGALRALSNLYNPFLQANAALCLLLLPAFVRTRGTPEGKRIHRMSLLVLTGGPLACWILFGIFNHQVINLVYRGKYAEYAGLMWIIGFQPVIAGMCGVYGSLLRAHQKMNAVLWAGVVAATSTVVLGIAMTKLYGMAGVCWSIVLSYALHHITLWLFSRSMSRKNKSRLISDNPAEEGRGNSSMASTQAA